MYICVCGGVQSCVSEHVKLSSCLLLWTQTPHLCFRNESCWHEAVSAELVLSLFLLNCYQLTKTKPRTQETGKSTHPVHPVVTQLELSLLLCSKTNCLMHVLEMIRRFAFKAHLGLQHHSSWALNLKVFCFFCFFLAFVFRTPQRKLLHFTHLWSHFYVKSFYVMHFFVVIHNIFPHWIICLHLPLYQHPPSSHP